jgi:hypothetical protein
MICIRVSSQERRVIVSRGGAMTAGERSAEGSRVAAEKILEAAGMITAKEKR